MSPQRAGLALGLGLGLGMSALFATGLWAAEPSKIQQLLSLREQTRAQVCKTLAPAKIDPNVAYQKIKPVERISNPERWPGLFYFRGEKLMMIYVSGPSKAFLDGMDAKQIGAELGPGHPLPSRAGKTSNQHVYPEKGFAFSEENGKIDFFEIFPPMTLAQYLDGVYQPVGRFVK